MRWTLRRQEGKQGSAGKPTYAVVTSRSFHSGGVNGVRPDGSVLFVSSDIAPEIWQAQATRNGGATLHE